MAGCGTLTSSERIGVCVSLTSSERHRGVCVCVCDRSRCVCVCKAALSFILEELWDLGVSVESLIGTGQDMNG